jgi:3-deoxy-manno-octulosonate cytidylyltransferase (CMP-KDO synthetase)
MAQVVGIVPARYASTRLPGKPLVLIQNRPMIQHVYERALKAASLERLVVATDDSRIHDAVIAFGGEVLMTSADHASGTDRVAEAARRLLLAEDALVVNIQGDEPLLEPQMVDELVAALSRAEDAPMATLAHPGTGSTDLHDPAVVKVVFDRRRQALYFSRAPIPAHRDGTATPTYFKHLGFYAYRNAFLQQFTKLPAGVLENLERLEQLRALEHGFPILVVITAFDSISVDTPVDLDHVEEIMEK